MPELPEVETVRATLKPRLLGLKITGVEVYHHKMIAPLDVKTFQKHLIGKTIEDIKRRGKYLLFYLGEMVLIVHLRMEGKFFIKSPDALKLKHEHIIFTLSNGVTLRYDDVRKFGTFTLVKAQELYHSLPLKKLGFEPGEDELTVNYLKSKLKSKRQIKTVLLDQTIILGLGNIYVDEVLFCAKINPTKLAYKVTKKEALKIIECSKSVIKKAVQLGGSSIRSYTDSLGVTGRFQNELNVHMQENTPCKVCQTPIKKIKVSQRGTYYCPQCQSLRKKANHG